MTMKITSVLFMSAILFTAGIAASTTLIQDAEAYTYTGKSIKQTGSKLVCGDKLCSEYEGGRAGYEAKKAGATEAIQEKISEIEREQQYSEKKVQTKTTSQQQLEKIQAKIDRGESLSQGEITIIKKIMSEHAAQETAEGYYSDRGGVATGTPSFAQHAFGLSASGTMTSQQDPGQGHEAHQIAVILPPSDKVYVGKITFSASEPVQYVTIHGPLAEGESGGQPIWVVLIFSQRGTLLLLVLQSQGQFLSPFCLLHLILILLF